MIEMYKIYTYKNKSIDRIGRNPIESRSHIESARSRTLMGFTTAVRWVRSIFMQLFHWWQARYSNTRLPAFGLPPAIRLAALLLKQTHVTQNGVRRSASCVSSKTRGGCRRARQPAAAAVIDGRNGAHVPGPTSGPMVRLGIEAGSRAERLPGAAAVARMEHMRR